MTGRDRPKAMFRRASWHGGVGSGRPPLWHRYAGWRNGVRKDRMGHEFTTLIVTAMCGYEHAEDIVMSADGAGFSSFSWRERILGDRLRCSKCDRKAGIGR
jgi:hypothetical protein